MAGASHSQMQEAADIFGPGVSDLFAHPEQPDEEVYNEEIEELDEGRARRPSRTTLQEAFEPSLVAERLITEKDRIIRDTDAPEREQLRFPSSVQMPGMSPNFWSFSKGIENLKDEAQWIYQKLFKDRENNASSGQVLIVQEKVLPKVETVLQFIHEEHFEVPYINIYKKVFYSIIFLIL